jgi:hypothetical protein
MEQGETSELCRNPLQVNDKYTVNKVERLIDKPHDTAKIINSILQGSFR